jgi:hypothetical protein
MTETEKVLWRPVVGSLVVIFYTGASGIVKKITRREFSDRQDAFTLMLVDSLYFDNRKAAEKGATVILSYAPSFENREKACIDVLNSEGTVMDFRVMQGDELKDERWLLVRHQNDGAPETSRFKFNSWVSWDGGKHEDFKPAWNGGHNYNSNRAMPCANVKIDNPGKLLADRSRVEEQIGKLTDEQWERYTDWLEGDEHEGSYEHAVEDAREGVSHLFEDTGLEYSFGGRSGGWFCLENVCEGDIWELEPLSDEENQALDGYYELEKELSEEHLATMRELDERRDNALCKGDKAVVRSALHQMEMYAEDEVAYQFMSNVARKFRDLLDEEEEAKTDKDKRNAGRTVVKGFIDQSFVEITKKEMIAGLEAFDDAAKADGWDWNKED